jgi:pimeloyl-ACP methyl ester carboxylesterase
MDTSARVPDNLAREPIELAARIAREAGMPQLAKLMRARSSSPEASRTDADRRLEAEWGDRYWDEWRFPNYHAMDPHAFGAFGAALFDQIPLGARLAEIRCPTLVLVGSGDTGFLAAADELVRDIPDSRLARIPEAGHQPQLENPSAWHSALRDHLARVRGAV